EIAPAKLRPVTDALYLEALFEAVGDPLDHVRDQRAGQPVQRAVLTAVGGPLDEYLISGQLDLDLTADALGELAFGSVDGDPLGVDRHGDSGRYRDGLLADAGHRSFRVTRPSPRVRRRRRAGAPHDRSSRPWRWR